VPCRACEHFRTPGVLGAGRIQRARPVSATLLREGGGPNAARCGAVENTPHPGIPGLGRIQRARPVSASLLREGGPQMLRGAVLSRTPRIPGSRVWVESSGRAPSLPLHCERGGPRCSAVRCCREHPASRGPGFGGPGWCRETPLDAPKTEIATRERTREGWQERDGLGRAAARRSPAPGPSRGVSSSSREKPPFRCARAAG